MLRGNLSTKPFYNERLVSLVLLVVGVAALVLTLFNAQQISVLSAERAALRTEVDANNAQANRIRSEADAIQRAINRTELDGLLLATREANGLIDRRAFSWTVFFDYIESTLPIDVRLVAVQPRVDRGAVVISMLVVTRQQRHLQDFVDRLGETRAFQDVFVTNQSQNDDGTIGASIETHYTAPARQPSTRPVPAEGAGGRP